MSFNLAVNKNRTILTLMLLLITLTTQGAGMNSLSDYQWKNRLILVQATDENAGEIDTLRSARAEVDDRDIVWFVNTGADLVSNQDGVSSSLESEIKALLDQFRSDERVLLIGKDGGLKSREPSLDLDAIFRRIDRMPMRMREMRSD